MKTPKPKGPSKAALARKVLELEAQIASSYHFADASLNKAGSALMASGCLIQLTALGGRELICPVVIKDGLSDATIAALRADIRRSYDLATAFKPKPLTA